MPIQPSYWKVLTRRKILKTEAEEETKLNRVLGLFDLTALGVGATLGAGVYVLAGQIAKDQAGPSVMISFAIAAFASALAGICYAEFGARVPKAGSAYVYSYVCIGEFVAFIIGWNLILEYVIGTAGVCRGISLYLDTLLNDTLKTSFAEVAPIQWSFLGGYFDFLAFALAVVFGVITAFGVETSTALNNFCTVLNIAVLLFVIIAGSVKADISNWQVDPSSANLTSYNIGKGGYFPFGFEGTLKGAATCFFGFVGFDCIATTGEEVRNPVKNIPRSILYSLLIIFLCYFGVSTVLTLMVPYYNQDPNAPLPYAFKEVGWNFAMWVVTIGGLIGLLASLFGALFPIPRILYSMAEDGLLFRFLGKVSPRFKTPVTGSIFAALFTGIIAGSFNLAQLVNLLSIGTLLAYTVVAISITILRFMNSNGEPNSHRSDCQLNENSTLTSNDIKVTFKTVLRQMFNFRGLSTPSSISKLIVGTLILLFCIISLLCGLLIMNASEAILNYESWALTLLGIFVSLIVILLTAIWMQPKEIHTSIFRVPLVPLVPAISIFINIYLMLQLDVMTWIRFGLWMVIDNGVCNNSVKILVSQPSKAENEQNCEDEFRKASDHKLISPSILEENTRENAIDKNRCLEDHHLTYPQEETSQQEIITIEEENSVIALLDNVLESEDDGIAPPDYIQEESYDSEATPNFVETTTIAMVHSNFEPNSNELENCNPSNTSFHTNNLLYTEASQLAFILVEEILQSDDLVRSVEMRKKRLEDTTQNAIQTCKADNTNESESLDLTQPTLNEDPLRSENFKSKLSLLILQPPWASRFKKHESPILPKTEFNQELKPSKSEADMQKMVPKMIEPTSVEERNDTSKKETLDIPIPPKFDPVLYRTIGHTVSNSVVRTRPSIDKLILDTPKQIPLLELPEEEVPFKTKLEAILRRGPSHRVSKRSDLITSQTPISADNQRFSEDRTA